VTEHPREAVTLIIPHRLATTCQADAASAAWLERLPDLVSEAQRRWSLSVASPFGGDEGSCAWVAPVTLARGEHAVLKIGLPHMEAEQEIAGLRFWNGQATVRLIDADESLNAMLLEACVPGTPLRRMPEHEQDSVIGRLLPRLWQSPPVESPFRALSDMLDRWAEETLEHADRWRDPALVRAGLDLFRELPKTAERQVLLFTDLHAGNVLRAERAPWLAIDPKPFLGDPAYDATQHLLNCPDRMRAKPDLTIASFADALELSRERVRLWTFARAAAEPRSDWSNDTWIDVARQIAP
jgi:streptomycin 6-kinase